MARGAESTCKHCREPITYGAGKWWHRAGWFSLCKNRVTRAEPIACGCDPRGTHHCLDQAR